MSHVPPRRAARRRAGMLAALGLSALALGPVASAQAIVATPDSWTGAGTPDVTTGYLNWSDNANWTNNAPMPGQTLQFPAITSPCGGGTCHNDLVAGTSFDGLTIDSSSNYDLTGNGIVLTGPITSTTADTSTPSNSSIDFPVDIGSTAGQWSITGGIGSPSTGDVPSGLSFSAPVTGSATLGVTLAHEAQLSFGADNELGAVTFSGGPVDNNVPAGSNGTVLLNEDPTGSAPASLNGTNGNPVNVDNVELDAQSNTANPITTGALSLQRGSLVVGNPFGAGGGLTVNGGITIDATSDTTFYVNSTGSTARTDYSQLSASANVALDGSLTLRYGPDCATPASAGTQYTLVTTPQTVSGTFTGGRFATLTGYCQATNTDITTPVRLDYGTHTVTATVLNGSTTTLVQASGSSQTNQAVTLTAAVTPSAGTAVGTVEFDNYGRPIAGCDMQPVNGGSATCTTQDLVGANNLTAVFNPSGSSDVGGSQSPVLADTVNPDPTMTVLSASSTSVVPGSKVTYSATVSPADNGPNQPNQWGGVQFSDHGTPIDCGTGNGSSGEPMDASNTATCSVTYPTAGSHSITAAYVGDGYAFGTSTSAAKTVSVAAPASTPTPTTTTTTTTPAPVPAPAPAGTGAPSIGHVATSGATAALPLSCAKGGASCTITVKLTTSVRVPSITHKGVRARHTITQRVITVGTAQVTLAAGQHKTLKITLNRTGKHLLATHKHINTQLTVSRKTTGKAKTVSTRTVTFKAAKRHH